MRILVTLLLLFLGAFAQAKNFECRLNGNPVTGELTPDGTVIATTGDGFEVRVRSTWTGGIVIEAIKGNSIDFPDESPVLGMTHGYFVACKIADEGNGLLPVVTKAKAGELCDYENEGFCNMSYEHAIQYCREIAKTHLPSAREMANYYVKRNIGEIKEGDVPWPGFWVIGTKEPDGKFDRFNYRFFEGAKTGEKSIVDYLWSGSPDSRDHGFIAAYDAQTSHPIYAPANSYNYVRCAEGK